MLNVDFDEAELERVIYRDASSEYLLNGSQVRLRDIVEVLSGAHIGASGHHIISQGEADRILNAGMRERREMIEDALGLKIYQWKREESERKLLKTEENMKQVEGLRKEIAPHLLFLKKQAEKIEKTRSLKEGLRALYGEYLTQERGYIAAQKEAIAAEERAPKQELSGLERQLAAAKKTVEKEHGQDTKARAVIELEKKITAFRGERDALSRELGRLEGEIAAAERLAKIGVTGVAGEETVPLREIADIEKQVEEGCALEDTGALRQAFEKLKGALRALVEKYRKQGSRASEQEKEAVAALREKKSAGERKLSAIQEAEAVVAQDEKKLRAEIEKEKDSSRDAEKEMFRIMARQNELRGAQNGLRIRLHEIEHVEGDFKREIAEGALLVGREILEYEKDGHLPASGLPEDAHLTDRDAQEERRRKIERLKIRIEEAGGGSGAEVLKEFEEARARDQFLVRELADLERAAHSLRQLIRELEEKIDAEFCAGIQKINDAFQSFFSVMFGGGSAKLSVIQQARQSRHEADAVLLEDDTALQAIAAEEEQESAGGIDITVNLPRKKIKGLMMLSGGERALTSIALIFAMSQVKPPPFIILDETDAALDEANSRKYGDMVENLSKHSQLILITHNRETMSRAGMLYGVTMDTSGVSKLLSIAFDEAVAVAK